MFNCPAPDESAMPFVVVAYVAEALSTRYSNSSPVIDHDEATVAVTEVTPGALSSRSSVAPDTCPPLWGVARHDDAGTRRHGDAGVVGGQHYRRDLRGCRGDKVAATEADDGRGGARRRGERLAGHRVRGAKVVVDGHQAVA